MSDVLGMSFTVITQVSPIHAHAAPAEADATSYHITSDEQLLNASEEHPLTRLRRKGPDALSDGELVALLLQPWLGDSALSVALSLLKTHKGLRGLRKIVTLPHLAAAIGGEEIRAALLAAFSLAERSALEPLTRGESYTSSKDSRRYLQQRLGDRESEVFAALFLDTRHRLIEYRELFFGTVDATNVYFREVLRIAMSLNCAALVLCHNHPSGDTKPSDADIEITRSLRGLLELVDVRILDHIVVTSNASCSMMELGLI